MKINNKEILFSCVLDYNPQMAVQTYIWVVNLLENNISPKNIYVHLIGDIPQSFNELLKYLNIQLVKQEPFDPRNRYCNKLVQLDTFNGLENWDYVFLMDCDTALVDLTDLTLNNKVYGKIVDIPNPPFSILKDIFKKANLQVVEQVTDFARVNDRLTDSNNCNGGLYIISREYLKALSPVWKDYASWCIDNDDIFTQRYSKHADQVSFAMANRKLGTTVSLLGIEWNFPLHADHNLNVKPHILHYHDLINEHLEINFYGLPEVDKQIKLVNERIRKHLKLNLDNELFWTYRYLINPTLGSGVGSRGEVLEYKRKLLKNLTINYINDTIVDVGCGDLEVIKPLPFKNYLGLDISEEALKIAQNKRNDWRFQHKKITDESIEPADLIMCLDVLIHQSEMGKYEQMVEAIVRKAKKRIIIGAYQYKPEISSTITHFHSAILDEVKKYGKFDELCFVGRYRDVDVLVGTVNENNHQRDIGSVDLNKAFQEVSRPDLLQFLVDVSRENLGFYTAHYPRVFEYSWLLEQLEKKEKLRILDLGSGVCPLPLCLNLQGHNVTTVDSHSKSRDINNKEEWNEWGFLDYGLIDPGIKSKNIDFSKFRTFKKFDVIYSISVIEHMPKEIREKVIKKASKLLKRGGHLLLTIDLVPGTDELWNLSEGKIVESNSEHGNVGDLQNEIKNFGFEIVSLSVQSEIMNSRTDIMYLVAKKR